MLLSLWGRSEPIPLPHARARPTTKRLNFMTTKPIGGIWKSEIAKGSHSAKSQKYAHADHKLQDANKTMCGLKINSYNAETFRARIGQRAGFGRWLNVSEQWITTTCEKCLQRQYKVSDGQSLPPIKTRVSIAGSVRSILFQDLEPITEPRTVKASEVGKLFPTG